MPDLLPEQLSRSQIHDLQSQRLRELLDEVAGKNPFWTRKYESVDLNTVQSVDDLHRLPICTKSELVADQTAHPPYGTNLTYPKSDYSRLHQTSGTTGRPMRWLDTPASWNWFMDCWACIYRLTGITEHDVFAFPFSFGPFIGFWAAFEGAGRLGNLCLSGGGMSSQARLQLIAENSATVVCCTPTYALRLAEVAAEQGIDLAGGSVQKLIVAGEPGASIPATKQRIESAWGADLFDHWGMTEIGALAVEPLDRRGGLTMLEHQCIAEILDSETMEPVAPGEQGELVITNLGRLGSPLIRYRTGDLVQAAEGPSESGCNFIHLEGGILGRADDMVTIRGNNVFPSSLEAILREFDTIAEYRIEVREVRSMHQLKLEIEPTPEANVDTLVGRVSRTIKDRLNFQPEVSTVPVGSLPRFELKGRRFNRV